MNDCTLIFIKTKPTACAYWKRYGRKISTHRCDLERLKVYGRLILEALHFIYANGFVYGHLHSGNILFDLEQAQPIKFVDMANTITGLSSKYRTYLTGLKNIRVNTNSYCNERH
jgi:hypothetical protein